MRTEFNKSSAKKRPSNTKIFQRISINDLNQASDAASDELILREFSDRGDFLGAIRCPSGQITVLAGKHSFASALIERGTSSAVSIRLGVKELRESDIHVASTADVLTRRSTVWRTLQLAGCPEHKVQQELQAFGLDALRERHPDTLDRDTLWRLTFACALHAREKVIVIDDPFKRLDNKWIERIASILADHVESSTKIYVVTNLSRMPSSWRLHPKVAIQELEKGEGRTTRLGMRRRTSDDLITSVRSMMRENRAHERERRYMITRPHAIRGGSQRVAVPEALQTEAIVNPAISELNLAAVSVSKINQALKDKPVVQAPAASRTRIATQKSPTQSSRRNTSLTEVTSVERINQMLPWMRFMRKLKRRFETAYYALLPSSHILPAKRVEYWKKRSRIATYIPPLLAILFLLLMMSWVRAFW